MKECENSIVKGVTGTGHLSKIIKQMCGSEMYMRRVRVSYVKSVISKQVMHRSEHPVDFSCPKNVS